MAETWVSMPELQELLGKDRAVTLCKLRGGVPIYVPAAPDSRHLLAGILGLSGMRLLCLEFAGLTITVPNGKKPEPRKADIIGLLREGLSHPAIAARLGVTERYVRMVAAAPAPQVRQLTLFP